MWPSLRKACSFASRGNGCRCVGVHDHEIEIVDVRRLLTSSETSPVGKQRDSAISGVFGVERPSDRDHSSGRRRLEFVAIRALNDPRTVGPGHVYVVDGIEHVPIADECDFLAVWPQRRIAVVTAPV